ncbi:MAG TPA: tRNA lysidine(34) synthetase TilS [Gemmatimonadaceae bacterium]|nr:tRNA lysidine(34) synthetase TilS [Gemmatimonadaceae bacterium]
MLAVSGGLDSMVLLTAVAEVVPRERLTVATFDHGTGDWASSAQRFVAARASALGIRCVEGTAERGARNGRYPHAKTPSEAQLRAWRWAFLGHVSTEGGAICATGHTEDDQIETVLLRLLRGAGARGLTGLYADGEVSRPFVSLRRRTLEEYARRRRVEWMEDPSNVSRSYFRNRVRHDLLPALRRASPTIDEELLGAARRSAAWRRDVERFVDRVVRPRVYSGAGAIDVPVAAMSSVSLEGLRILWPAIAARVGVVMDRRGVERLSEFAERGRVGARVQLAGGWEVLRSRHALEVRRARRHERTFRELSLSNPTRCGDWSFQHLGSTIEGGLWVAWLPADRPVAVREWQPGDSMVDAEGGPPRKVKRLLSKAGVTGHKRVGWPVVVVEGRIVWIPGVRRSVLASNGHGQLGLPFMCEYVNC